MRGNPAQCAAELGRRRRQCEKDVKAVLKSEITAAKKFAMSLSKGSISSLALARMGHPYATRNPRPPQPTEIINRQTGLFLNSFVTQSKTSNGTGEMWAWLVNTAPEAKYLVSGTHKMIVRPIDKAVQLIMVKRFRLAVQDAIHAALKI